MKVEKQAQNFHPVTITIETRREFYDLIETLTYLDKRGILSSIYSNLLKELRNL